MRLLSLLVGTALMAIGGFTIDQFPLNLFPMCLGGALVGWAAAGA